MLISANFGATIITYNNGKIIKHPDSYHIGKVCCARCFGN